MHMLFLCTYKIHRLSAGCLSISVSIENQIKTQSMILTYFSDNDPNTNVWFMIIQMNALELSQVYISVLCCVRIHCSKLLDIILTAELYDKSIK